MSQNHIVLIGAGIMSATLGIFIHELIPDIKISIFERLDKVGAESSDAWNNAGTGHSAFCELNYTPYREDGSVDLSKALRISQNFEVSKQLWAYLRETGKLSFDVPFINDIDHMSFVLGNTNRTFLQNRYEAMIDYPMFKDMKYSQEADEIKEWIPLMMEGRGSDEVVTATRMDIGTDVNFGAITRGMITFLETCDNVSLHLGHCVQDITRLSTGQWKVEIEDLHESEDLEIIVDYIFIGAGGGAIPLLEKSSIPQAEGYGGFPVSGQFLVCTQQDVVQRHEAKVYGKASVGAPPMSVPHLDTRMLDGQRSLLFGPYAGFSTKFLKNGSYMDLPLSIEMHNVWPMLSAGIHNIALTKYLIKQVVQSPEDRFETLLTYFPNAKISNWNLKIAGQRVQIIKKDKKRGGVLKFGTEIVSSADHTLSALLGASPGASSSVAIMLDVLKIMFCGQLDSVSWQKKIKKMIPTYGLSLHEDGNLCLNTRARTTEILKLSEQGV